MTGINYLKKFDKKQLFRFFVDGRFHSKYQGWLGYEKMEPGSVQAMLNGFRYMIENFDLTEGLNGNYLINLHKICMFNVVTTNYKSSPGDLRYLNSGMPFFKKTTTYEHLEEVLELRKYDDTVIFNTEVFLKKAEELNIEEVYKFLQKEGKLNYRPWYPNLTIDMQKALNQEKTLSDFYEVKNYIQIKFALKIDEIVAEFNKSIINSKNDDEKILTISKIVRDLELLHPFPDGNCRTFANVLLNHLLMFYGFPPSILVNPNLDGEYSYKQFAEIIKTGINNTEFLIDNPLGKLYNFSISELSDLDNKKFLEMSKELIHEIESYKEIFLTPPKLENVTGGKWFNFNPFTRFNGVGSHTTIPKGCIYFCFTKDWLKENKNIDFEIRNAIKKGARALIIDDENFLKSSSKPILLVDDCEKQMKNIAAFVRREVNCKTLLVTGTVGKTGFKFQLNHCLNNQTKIHAFLNSTNTKIPVMRTLMSLEEDDKVEIVELSVGSSYQDAIDRSIIISPNICVFTDIDQNHMNLHKSVDNLVRAKASTITGIQDNGICIINSKAALYDKLLIKIKEFKVNVRIITFGDREKDNARLLKATFDNQTLSWNIKAMIEDILVEYTLPIFHSHAPIQSLGVLLAVKYLGYDVQKASKDYSDTFKSFSSIGRIFRLNFDNKNVFFYDQSYRGAINGMRSAFKDIENMNLSKRKVFVIGGSSIKVDNEFTKQQHFEIAEMINNSGVDKLYTTGPYMNYVHDNLQNKALLVKHLDDLNELEKELKNELKDDDFLFIMASGDLYLGRLSDKVLNFGSVKILR